MSHEELTKPKELIPLSYFAGYYPFVGPALISEEYLNHIPNPNSLIITIEASKMEKSLPVKWKVCYSGMTLSKSKLDFDYESIPSERSDEYLEDSRFDSPEDAQKLFEAFLEKCKKEAFYLWSIGEDGNTKINSLYE